MSTENQKEPSNHSNSKALPFNQTYFHGTKADLRIGELISPGYNSNFGKQKVAKYIFLTATLDAAIWGAELAKGEGKERIYLVEPTGPIENDPDLTDRKFPGNPTISYRSIEPFKVLAEVTGWLGHPEEQVNQMKAALDSLEKHGIDSLNDE
ncbi:NAD(+)--rifampin ADP-ribosyltransferase [Marinoscillum pacificum]|uniref:NAD(+)--rifampin ADP-ribosyltransferase n=1 Tax=Marinoscillum pacificum TaxID=392723 RepID=UPI0021577BAD|nr:NAD(+)--rifampin ADP-ribosyltransferase [Marinoscillum pacificum]